MNRWGQRPPAPLQKGYVMPDKVFTTDGCSGGMSAIWRVLFKKPPPWEGDCTEHDESYWEGYPAMGILMYYFVRCGDVPWMPTPWRWNYGYTFPNKLYYFDPEEHGDE